MTVHSWDRSGRERGDDGGCMWRLIGTLAPVRVKETGKWEMGHVLGPPRPSKSFKQGSDLVKSVF